ncbi:MAG TPA: hypothetical protein ENN97_04690, partial [Phycisphaerales bacterium]|nr:hypothetical protein [Phycisphaerales bacterium]
MSATTLEKTGSIAARRNAPPGGDRCPAAPGPVVSEVRVRQNEVIMFTTQLSVMLDSGVVLTDAMEAVSAQMRPGVFRD